MDITNKIDNPLLSRKEITARLTFEGKTPERAKLVKDIAKKMNAKPELVIVKRIHTKFGTTQADITAHVYEDADAMKKIEPGFMQKRHEKASATEKKASSDASDKSDQANTDNKEDTPDKSDKSSGDKSE